MTARARSRHRALLCTCRGRCASLSEKSYFRDLDCCCSFPTSDSASTALRGVENYSLATSPDTVSARSYSRSDKLFPTAPSTTHTPRYTARQRDTSAWAAAVCPPTSPLSTTPRRARWWSKRSCRRRAALRGWKRRAGHSTTTTSRKDSPMPGSNHFAIHITVTPVVGARRSREPGGSRGTGARQRRRSGSKSIGAKRRRGTNTRIPATRGTSPSQGSRLPTRLSIQNGARQGQLGHCTALLLACFPS